MAQGTITLTKSGSGELYGQIIWSSVSNSTAANTSTVMATIQLKRPAGWYTQGTWKGSLNVGGMTKQISYHTTVRDSWVTIDTLTATVSHNADGTGSCYIYGLINGPTQTSMSGTSVSGSATVTLDPIARYASITSATSFDDEAGNPTIYYSNPAGDSVTSLQACISLTGQLPDVPYRDIPKTGTSYTFQLSEAERNTLRAASPNSNTLDVFFIIRTVIGGSENHSHVVRRMNIVNADPTISPTVVDTSATTGITGNSSILVAGKSTARVTINATAKKYATITSRSVEHGGQVLTGDGTLSVTNNPIKITVTDSRGNSVTQNTANTIIAYFSPTCSIGNNLPETDGTFSLVVSGLFYNGSIGKTSNTLTVQYRRKTAGGSYGSWTNISSVTKSGNSYTATANLTGLDYQTIYTFQARAIDALNTDGVASAEKAVISQPVFDWGKNDFQFNVPVSIPSEMIPDKGVVTSESNLQTLLTSELRTMPLASKKTISASFSFGGHGGGYYIIDLYKMAFDGYAYADASNYGNMWTRYTLSNNAWIPEEWVNPPMMPGVEYRTTEKFQGNPVYKKLVEFGYTAAGSNTLNHGISVAVPISVEIYNQYSENVTKSPDAKGVFFNASSVVFERVYPQGNTIAFLTYTKS